MFIDRQAVVSPRYRSSPLNHPRAGDEVVQAAAFLAEDEAEVDEAVEGDEAEEDF